MAGDGVHFLKNNQLLCYNPNIQQWTNPKCFGAVPAPRSNHCSTIIKHKIWVLGGYNQYSTPYDDIYELTMHSLTWTQIQTVQPRPQARSNCTLTAATNNQLVLHGGYGSNGTLNDTWIMDLTSHSWRRYKSRKDHTRRSHTGSLDLNNNVIIIGGCKDYEDHESYNSVFHVILETKSLQQLAARTIYKYQDELNWNGLPKKLTSLIGISHERKRFTCSSKVWISTFTVSLMKCNTTVHVMVMFF